MSEDHQQPDTAFEPSLLWDGTTKFDTLTADAAALRRNLADHAKRYEWTKVLAILRQHPDLVNSCRPEGRSLYAPLHQAAHGGAGPSIILELLKHGAWRTLRDANGTRPVDIAKSRSHAHLVPLLEPVFLHSVPPAALSGLQQQFHEVIRQGGAGHLVRTLELRLPELEILLECPPKPMWFAVPGMYGGFSYWLERAGPDPLLISESWCRIVGGSGQRHEITKSRWTMVDSEFV